MRTLADVDVDVDGRRVLVRVDFNVPLEAGRITDDTRIRAALPTIEELRRRGARLVLASDLGRPKDREPDLSLRPVAERIAELIGAEVALAPGVVGPAVRAAVERLPPGDVLMLENVRYEPGETRTTPISRAGSPSSSTSTWTTPSAPPTAPTPAPRESPVTSPSGRPACCCSARSRRCAASSSTPGGRSSPSSAARR